MSSEIAIVGGGFTGVALSWQLLRGLRSPTTIHLVNKGALARGLAYGTPSPHHLLNVPAGRMGLSPSDEQGFLRYLRRIGLPFEGGDFVPRALYGAYLEFCLGCAQAEAAKRGVELRIHQGAVSRVELGADQRKILTIHPAKGGPSEQLQVHSIVLALGNFPSVPPALRTAVDWTQTGLHASSWSSDRLAPADLHAPVLLVGSGLTAYDVLLQLRHEGHRGPVTMLSRRGLCAQAHRLQETPPPQKMVAADVLKGERSLWVMFRHVRQAIRQAQAQGNDWRDVIGGMRAQTPRLWSQLPDAERRRFLRHLAPYWETHRHRAAVSIAMQVDAEREAGTLISMAGRLSCLQREGNSWRVDVLPRGQAQNRSMLVDSVINCTGPSSDVRKADDPLLQQLLASGVVTPDALGLGVNVDTDYRLMDSQGMAQPGLRYVGPLLKASFWEATAVPELRVHASHVAKAVCRELNLKYEDDRA
jgi:uncharacterized NAD(P)/FAD-binding protein YdhS